MPMWIVHAPEGVYSVEDKKNLTETLTQIYVEFSNLPKFYVVVRFDEYPADSMWLGGEPANDFVRFVVDHIARRLDPAYWEFAINIFAERLQPFTTDRGLRTEIHVDETPIDLWRVNGLKPPAPDTEAEKRWAEDNAPSAYDADEAVRTYSSQTRSMFVTPTPSS
jgi:phenylpyruvate tautomerase PptA (4-oxalocrotonate tautomerase family)